MIWISRADFEAEGAGSSCTYYSAWRLLVDFHPEVTPVTPSPWQLTARDIGVIDMAFLNIIRRWALQEHLSIREIARQIHQFTALNR